MSARHSVTLDGSKGGCATVLFKSSTANFLTFSTGADNRNTEQPAHSSPLPSILMTFLSFCLRFAVRFMALWLALYTFQSLPCWCSCISLCRMFQKKKCSDLTDKMQVDSGVKFDEAVLSLTWLIIFCLHGSRYNMWTMAWWRTSQWSMCTLSCCLKMFLSCVCPASCTASTL